MSSIIFVAVGFQLSLCANLVLANLTPGGQHVVCYSEHFNASCPSGTVIMVDHASYGRIKVDGRCIKSSVNVGCAVDVRQYVERRCAGRRQCSMSANLQQVVRHGCMDEFNGYLAVNYTCLPVYDVDVSSCSQRNPLEITASSGYLANVVTADTGRGLAQCPWLIRGHPGQTVNISLLDFGDLFTNGDGTRCTVYVRMKTSPTAIASSICGGQNRSMVLYAIPNSREDVSIELLNTTGLRNPVYFLIHFQVNRGKECFDYDPPADVVVVEQQNNYTLTVKCQADIDGRSTWMVSCIDEKWSAPTRNQLIDCSREHWKTSTIGGVHTDSSSSPGTGIGILIFVSVFLLILLICFAVAFAFYIKRKTVEPMPNGQCEQYGYGRYAGRPPDGPMDQCGNMITGVMMDPYVGRSQKDLLDCCNNGPPLPLQQQQQRQHRDYATTLEMRRVGNQIGPWQQHQGPWPTGQNQMGPDVWTTGCSQCPVHGGHDQYGHDTWATGRRHPAHHVYDLPYGEEDDFDPRHDAGVTRTPRNGPRWQHGPGVGGTSCVPAHAGGGVWNAGAVKFGQPSSPFYNELEPFNSIDSTTCILPQSESRSQAGGGGGGGSRTGDQQQKPPIPLTKL